MPLSSVAAVSDALGFEGTLTDRQTTAITRCLNAARVIVIDDLGDTSYETAEAEDITDNLHLATELVAVDLWRSRSATRDGGVFEPFEGEVIRPNIVYEARRLLTPHRRLKMFSEVDWDAD